MFNYYCCMKTLAERIAHIKEAMGWTNAEVARQAATSRAAVTDWLNGNVQNLSAMVANNLSAASGYSAVWLATGEGEDRPTNKNEKKKEGVVLIEQFDTGGAMGTGVVLREQPGVINSWEVTDDWVTKNIKHHTAKRNLKVVTGFGDSMKGMFNPGDPLVIDVGVNTLEHDGVYFFRVGSEGFIKTLQRIPGQGILVISHNPTYRDWTITPEMDFQVFGKVIKVWESTDF